MEEIAETQWNESLLSAFKCCRFLASLLVLFPLWTRCCYLSVHYVVIIWGLKMIKSQKTFGPHTRTKESFNFSTYIFLKSRSNYSWKMLQIYKWIENICTTPKHKVYKVKIWAMLIIIQTYNFYLSKLVSVILDKYIHEIKTNADFQTPKVIWWSSCPYSPGGSRGHHLDLVKVFLHAPVHLSAGFCVFPVHSLDILEWVLLSLRNTSLVKTLPQIPSLRTVGTWQGCSSRE